MPLIKEVNNIDFFLNSFLKLILGVNLPFEISHFNTERHIINIESPWT